MRDPHAVLGVASGAEYRLVSAAWRALTKRWHPDRAREPEATRRMQEINAAYDFLRTESRVAALPKTPMRDPGPGRQPWECVLDDCPRSACGVETCVCPPCECTGCQARRARTQPIAGFRTVAADRRSYDQTPLFKEPL